MQCKLVVCWCVLLDATISQVLLTRDSVAKPTPVIVSTFEKSYRFAPQSFFAMKTATRTVQLVLL